MHNTQNRWMQISIQKCHLLLSLPGILFSEVHLGMWHMKEDLGCGLEVARERIIGGMYLDVVCVSYGL